MGSCIGNRCHPLSANSLLGQTLLEPGLLNQLVASLELPWCRTNSLLKVSSFASQLNGPLEAKLQALQTGPHEVHGMHWCWCMGGTGAGAAVLLLAHGQSMHECCFGHGRALPCTIVKVQQPLKSSTRCSTSLNEPSCSQEILNEPSFSTFTMLAGSHTSLSGQYASAHLHGCNLMAI